MPSFNVQNAKALTISEGDVKTIHDSDGRLLWGALNYDVTFDGDIFQLSYTGDNLFTDSSDVIDSEHCTYNYDDGVYTITNTDESDPSLTLGIYLPAGYYTIDSDSSLSANTQFVNGDTVVTSISSNYSNYTFNLDEPCTGIKFNWASTSDHIVLGLNTLQIISTAPTPSTPQPISVVKGHQTVTLTGGTVSGEYPLNLTSKNLWGGFASSVPIEGANLSFINNADGTISVTSGTASSQHVSLLTSLAVSNNHYITLKAGSYVVSGGTANIGLQVLDTTGVLLGTSTFTLTTEKQVYVRAVVKSGVSVTATTIKPQLELGSTPTSYAPYFTPIELCKIGTYQDYIWKDGSDWKLHKEIEKLILTGDSTEGWGYNGTNAVFVANDLADYLRTGFVPLCDYYLGQNISSYSGLQDNHIGFLTGTNSRTVIKNTSFTDVTNFKNWLSSHNTTVYYVLATPTDTQITDTTLISQLEAIHDFMIRYGYTSVVTGDLPIIINQLPY